MVTAAPTEARELDLVGKVEMRIALAKDDKLENLLKTYLAPLLLKLASDHASVRNKVVSTCQHIKVRLSGNQAVVLPVAALLKQYNENPDSAMVRHFDLMFIQHSIGKLPLKEQTELLPSLVQGLSRDAGKPTCATIFNLFLRVLSRFRLPSRGTKEDSELRELFGFNERPDDAEFVAQRLGKLILLVLNRRAPAPSANAPAEGLTVEEYEFLTLNGKPEVWDPTASEGLSLPETKRTALSFLASGAFTDKERFLPGLFASADMNSRISELGEDLLKRVNVDLEDPNLVSQLFHFYFGVKRALQTRILALLMKSAKSTAFDEQIIKLVTLGMQGEQSETGASLGLETLKFRRAMFNYVNWVSRVAERKHLEKMAPTLVAQFRSYIEEQGWPSPEDRSVDAASLRALAYETIGSMAKTTPSLVLNSDLSLVRWLFRSLTEEGSADTMFVSIEAALASLLTAFAPPLEPRLKGELRSLLLHYVTLQERDEIRRSARFVTVRWANRCLEYDDVVGRWIDILAIGGQPGDKSDVVEEGNKGLDPYWYRLINSSSSPEARGLPLPADLILAFFTDLGSTKLRSSNDVNTEMDVDEVPVFRNFSGTKVKSFTHAVSYCREILLLRALEGTEVITAIDADWQRQLDVLLRSDHRSRTAIREYMISMDDSAVSVFLEAALEGMLRFDGAEFKDCGKAFIDIASLAPEESIGRLARRGKELIPAIKSNNTATRFIAAQAFGILLAHPSVNVDDLSHCVQVMLQDIQPWAEAIGSEANKTHGCVLALGYVLSRSVYYCRDKEMEESLIQTSVTQILDVLINSKDKSMNEAVFTAINQLGTSCILTETRIKATPHSVSDVISKLESEAKKADEKAISALGHLAISFEDEPDSASESGLSTTIKNLYALSDVRQAETHFTIGEALSCACARWQSDSVMFSLDVDSSFVGPAKRPSTLKSLMDKLLTDSKTTKPSLKKASGIWLFCLIQFCGQLEEIQGRLRECQAAFMGLLSARDDLVQETASRGLSLVYEQGSKELKERLVSDLVSTFTGTGAKIEVDNDTELFEPGALPTGEGQSVTSYKDIMSLAAEVGDQTLVYKFMSLASNAATWSTRAAFGRFGLSNILSETEVDPKLYPKLYRYRFDPNSNVRRSMNDIWNALVKDSSATIDKHFDAIMDDLLKNILGKEWRTREASCAAIADLVQGRQFEKYEKYLKDVWAVAFKVLDDIKGSVRKAALSLCRVLTGILVRQLEAGTSSKHAQAMLKEVLPFLLSSQGMESSAKEVQLFALATVISLIKNGGKALLPFIADLVEQLLGLLSTIEPAELNYLYLNASNYGTTEEEIDSARSRMVSHSPLMDSIERCLDLVDEDTMKSVAARLESVIKTAIGMPTKVGCAGLLVSLSTRHSLLFRAHADTSLKAIEKAILDRNATVSAAYARSAGYLARLGSEKALLRLGTFSMNLYFSAEDEAHRQVSADILYAFSKFATDRFNSMSSEYLPFVFFAKHDFDDHVKEQFKKTWDENVGGSRAVLLYLKEIVQLAKENLDSQRWTIKHSAALSIAEVVMSAGDSISAANSELIWPALEKALALKTFDGKEEVLKAFVAFVKAGTAYWIGNDTLKGQLNKIAIREVKRNNTAYRPHAFAALGEYSAARTDLDLFEDVYKVIQPVLEELCDAEKMDMDEDAKGHKSKNTNTITKGVDALFRAVNTATSAPENPMPHLVQLAELLKPTLQSPDADVGTRTALYERAKAMFVGLKESRREAEAEKLAVARAYFELLELASGAGAETVRVKRVEAAEAVVLAVKSGVFGGGGEERAAVLVRMKGMVKEAREHERALGVQKAMDRVLALLD